MTERSSKISEHPDNARQWLVWQLAGGGAHVKFEAAVKDFPLELVGKRPGKLPYSAWQLVEHIRIAQDDIVDFCVNPEYKGMRWPDDYWPSRPVPGAAAKWEKSVRACKAGMRKMSLLIQDPKSNLYKRIPWGEGQTLMREALLLADHNAYHLGELMVLRRLLGVWPK